MHTNQMITNYLEHPIQWNCFALKKVFLFKLVDCDVVHLKPLVNPNDSDSCVALMCISTQQRDDPHMVFKSFARCFISKDSNSIRLPKTSKQTTAKTWLL